MKAITEILLHDFQINNIHSHGEYCFHNFMLRGSALQTKYPGSEHGVCSLINYVKIVVKLLYRALSRSRVALKGPSYGFWQSNTKKSKVS